jgi:peptidoglycan/LPS O-acetylase OafA/YrhL
MRIDDHILRPKENNLTLTRLILAASVIYSHSFFPNSEHDDLTWLLGSAVSYYAVDGFFVLSGFLVYRSLVQNGSVKRFAIARLTRLWPGLAAMAAIIIALFAFATGASPVHYLTGGDTLKFVFGNLSFLVGHYTLTDVRCGTELCIINGSLWTLPWEARCYVLLGVLALLGLANRKAMLFLVLPATAAFAILYDVPAVAAAVERIGGHGISFNLHQIDRLWTAFAMGIAAYELRHCIPLSWMLLVLLLLLNVAAQWWLPEAGTHMRALFIGYGALCLGFLSARRGAISGNWPDYSYGMYIYAFPVMTGLLILFDFPSHYLLGLCTLVLTVPFAAASWHFVEKPALDWLRRRQRTAYAAKTEPDAEPEPDPAAALPGTAS